MKIIDISVPVSPDLPVWPGDQRIILERYRTLSKGDGSNDSRLSCSVHSGTHVDAPGHFFENGSTVEHLPLDILIGRTWVAEVLTADVITPELLENLEIPSGTTRLLFKTKNSSLWADPRHAFKADFVALSTDAAVWIVDRGIRLVGIDYLSIQMFDDPEPLTHRTLLKAGVIIVEGINLQDVRPGSYRLVCLPLKLAGSDGAPSRAVLVEE
jgi:arylformamidase